MVMKRYACLLLAVLVGCGGDGEGEEEEERSRVAGTVATEQRCSDGDYRRVGSPQRAWAAVVRESARAYRQPGSGELARFGATNVNGVPTVLGVVGEVVDRRCEARW